MPTAKHQYIVHTSLRDDRNEGWVWIRNRCLKTELDGKRRIVRITAKPGKSIFCEALWADDWYMKKWDKLWINTCTKVPLPNENLAFISAWYRRRLGIRRGRQSLTIKYCKETPRPFWWQLRACLDHPQVVVRLATVLAIIGIGLGLIALGLGIVGVPDWRPYGSFCVGWFFMLLGVVVMVCGLWWGWRR